MATPHIAGQATCLDFRDLLKLLLEKMIQIDKYCSHGLKHFKAPTILHSFQGIVQESFRFARFSRFSLRDWHVGKANRTQFLTGLCVS